MKYLCFFLPLFTFGLTRVICCGQSERSISVGLRFGPQQVSILDAETDGLGFSMHSENLNRQLAMSYELTFSVQNESGRQFRLRSGVLYTKSRWKNMFSNDILSISGEGRVGRSLFFLGFGLGKCVGFGNFEFLFGIEPSIGFSLPYQSESVSDLEKLADSSFVRHVIISEFPGGWGGGIGSYFALQWRFTDRFFVLMEGRLDFGLSLSIGETEITTFSYDSANSLIENTVEKTSIQSMILTTPWWVSPPKIGIGYQF